MNKKDIQVWMREFRNFKDLVLELCYPTTCVLCGNLEARGLCLKCKAKYHVIEEPRCMKCGKPIFEYEEEYCSDCKNHSKFFLQGRSLWVHEKDVKQSIYRFKYKNKRIYARVYAKLLVAEYRDVIQSWRPEWLLPTPIHLHRRIIRGYNQSEVLAIEIRREILRECGVDIPVRSKVLYRKKETLYQKKLDNRQREKNIRGAFMVRMTEELPKSVIVVDDIYTTGATLNEISRVLRKSGVENVFFLTISIGQGF